MRVEDYHDAYDEGYFDGLLYVMRILDGGPVKDKIYEELKRVDPQDADQRKILNMLDAEKKSPS